MMMVSSSEREEKSEKRNDRTSANTLVVDCIDHGMSLLVTATFLPCSHFLSWIRRPAKEKRRTERKEKRASASKSEKEKNRSPNRWCPGRQWILPIGLHELRCCRRAWLVENRERTHTEKRTTLGLGHTESVWLDEEKDDRIRWCIWHLISDIYLFSPRSVQVHFILSSAIVEFRL